MTEQRSDAELILARPLDDETADEFADRLFDALSIPEDTGTSQESTARPFWRRILGL